MNNYQYFRNILSIGETQFNAMGKFRKLNFKYFRKTKSTDILEIYFLPGETHFNAIGNYVN